VPVHSYFGLIVVCWEVAISEIGCLSREYSETWIL